MKNVMLWAGAEQIGKAIARRIGTGMKIVVGDKKIENAQAMAKTMNEAGFDVAPVEMDRPAGSPSGASLPRDRSTVPSKCW